LYPSDVVVISPRAYVFVEERHFMEPVSRSTVVVNNTTIINQTVINEAPATAAIEKASGQKVQVVAVQELRHKAEAAVVARQRTPTATSEKTVQPPVRSEAQPAEKKAVAAHEPPQVEKHNPVPAIPEFKPEAKPEGNNHPPAIKEPAPSKADKQPVKQEKSAQPPAANEQNGPNPADKNHEDKVKE
jgi:hypothetical protein